MGKWGTTDMSFYLRIRVRLPHAEGKARGQDRAEFFRDEQRALPPFQPGLSDDLPES